MFVNKYKICSYFIFINKVGWVPTSAVNQKAIMDIGETIRFYIVDYPKKKYIKLSTNNLEERFLFNSSSILNKYSGL